MQSIGLPMFRGVVSGPAQFGNAAPKKETEKEMLARHERERMDARARAGGGDPRYMQVPQDVQKRHERELKQLRGGDTRHS